MAMPLKHPLAETVDFKNGERPILHTRAWVKTSHDNLVRVVAVDAPRLGQLYCVPTGIKNLFYIFSCKSNSYKTRRKILIKKQ